MLVLLATRVPTHRLEIVRRNPALVYVDHFRPVLIMFQNLVCIDMA